jgi:5-methylthioadenosine/S-adenosylhomocysteine deaminase
VTLRIADLGLRIADCGLRIADCGLRIEVLRYNRLPMKPWWIGLVILASVAAVQPARRSVSLIVIGRTVITQNPAHQVLTPGAVAVNGTDIVEVDRPEAIAARYMATETIDAGDQIILPGLINTHTHAPMVMFRGLSDDLALMDWLQKYIFPAEAKTVSPEFVRTGTRLAAL